MLAELSTQWRTPGGRFPAGDTSLEISRAFAAFLAGTNLITRDKLNQFLDSLEIDAFFFDKPAQAFEPDDVIGRVIAILISP